MALSASMCSNKEKVVKESYASSGSPDTGEKRKAYIARGNTQRARRLLHACFAELLCFASMAARAKAARRAHPCRRLLSRARRGDGLVWSLRPATPVYSGDRSDPFADAAVRSARIRNDYSSLSVQKKFTRSRPFRRS